MAEPHRNSSLDSRDHRDKKDVSWRYIKARLRILKRSEVWGSLVIVLITLLVFVEYWRRSDELGTVVTTDSETGVASLDNLSSAPPNLPSSEDTALAADIDTLPLLLNDLDPLAVNLPPLSETADVDGGDGRDDGSAPVQNSLLAPRERSPQAAQSLATSSNRLSSSTPVNTNPFGQVFSNSGLLPQSGISAAAPTSMSELGLLNGSSRRFGQTSAQVPLPQSNPLNDALQRGSGVPVQSSTGEEGVPQQGGAGIAAYGGTQVPPFTYTPSAIGNGQSLLQPPMQVSPPLGSTGYTLPPSLRGVPSSAPNTSSTINPYANSFQAQPIRSFPSAPQIVPQAIPLQPGLPGGGQSALSAPGSLQGPSFNSATPQFNSVDAFPQVQPDPPPFSVPNRVPGRYIGNGEINTFANP